MLCGGGECDGLELVLWGWSECYGVKASVVKWG